MFLAHLAMDSRQSKGRQYPLARHESQSTDPYVRDNIALGLSTTYRRLFQTRQVFRAVDSQSLAFRPTCQVMLRGGHVSVVAQTASRVAHAAGLNPWLCAAGGYAHDFGHLHKGHLAERFMQRYFPDFNHKKFGVLRLQEVDRLNLTHEVLQCVACNVKDGLLARTDVLQEHKVVGLSDKLSYGMHDTYDILRVLAMDGAPYWNIEHAQRQQLRETLWELIAPFHPSNWQPYDLGYEGAPAYWRWIETAVEALLEESHVAGEIRFEASPLAQQFWKLKAWLDSTVYPLADTQEDTVEMERVMDWLITANPHPEYDPYLVFCLLSDYELRAIAESLVTGSPGWRVALDDLFEDYPDLPLKDKVNLAFSFRFSGANCPLTAH